MEVTALTPYLTKEIIERCKDFTNYHKAIIGEKWYKSIMREISRADRRFKKILSTNPQDILNTDIKNAAVLALWLQIVLSTFGIRFGYSIYTPFSRNNIIIPERFNEELTVRLILYCDVAFKMFSHLVSSKGMNDDEQVKG